MPIDLSLIPSMIRELFDDERSKDQTKKSSRFFGYRKDPAEKVEQGKSQTSGSLVCRINLCIWMP